MRDFSKMACRAHKILLQQKVGRHDDINTGGLIIRPGSRQCIVVIAKVQKKSGMKK